MERQTLTVPFVKGLDVGNEEPQLTDKLLRLENAVINRHGAVDKRYGKTQISGSYAQDVLAAHGDRLSVIGATVQEMDSGSTFDTVASDVELATISSTPVISTEANLAVEPEVAVMGDLVYVSRGVLAGSAAHFDAISRSTGAAIATRYSVTAGLEATRLVYASAQSRIYAFYVNSSYELCCFAVSSDGSRGTTHNFTTSESWPTVQGTSGVNKFDAVLVNDDSIMVVFKQNQSAVAEADITLDENLGVYTLTTVGGNFAATDVGRLITITGSGTTNDGTYTVATFVDADNVTLTEAVVDEVGVADMSMEMSDLVIGAVTLSGDTITGTAAVTELVRPLLTSVGICKYTDDEAYVSYYQATTDREVRGVTYVNDDPPSVGEADHQLATWTTQYGFQVASVAQTDDSKVVTYYTRGANSTGELLMLYRCTYESGVGTNEDIVGGDVSLWGKPVVDAAGMVFLPVHHAMDSWLTTRGIQHSFFVLRDDLTNWPIPVARYFPDEACETAWRGLKTGLVQSVISDGTDKWLLIGKQLTGDYSDAAYTLLTERVDLHLVSIDTSTTYTKPLEVNSRELVVPSAVPLAVSNGRVYETGPLTYPEFVTAVPTDVGGGWSGTDGDFAYRCTYEIYVGGTRYESAPSPVVTASVLTGTHDYVRVTVPTLKITRLSTDAEVRIAIYRSVAAGSTAYLRICSLSNDPDASTTYYDDTGTANTGKSQEPTVDGTYLQNDPAYPFSIATVWQQRLFFADAQYTDRLVRYTKEFTEGYGPAFSSSLYIPVSPEGGDITALEAIGDRLVIFKRGAIYATSGEGKDATGAGYGYADPQLVSPSIGCIDQKSAVKTPAGILFQSDDCIFLLDPGMNLQPVGRPVKYHTDSLTIADSCVFPKYNIALFVTDGSALIYNYLFGVWTTWANMANTACCVANNVLYLKDESTGLWKYDPTTYLDAGATLVALAVETPWIMPAGPNMLNRVWEMRLLGHSDGARTVRVKIAYDHDPYWVDTLDVNTTDLGAFDHTEHYGTMATDYEDKALLLRFRGSRTKCSAIRFRIEEVAA